MFYTAEVRISEPVHENNKSIMSFLRCVGLFPLVVRKRGFDLFLQWSLWSALYSYTLGAAVLGLAFYGQIDDIFLSKGESIYIIFQTDKFVRFFGLFAHCSLTFSGIFVMSSKILKFVRYLECINQVDSIINTTYNRSDKLTPKLILFLLLGLESVVLFLENYTAFMTLGQKIGLAGIMKKNLALCVACEITLVVEYTNRHLVHGFEKRLVKLNELLDAEHKRLAKKVFENSPDVIELAEEADIILNTRCHLITMVRMAPIVKLRRTYSKLMDAVRILNDILEPNTLLAIASASLLLVVSLDFLVLMLEGKRGGPIQFRTRLLIFPIHTAKVLLITDPWHYCNLQIKTTTSWVCKLLSLQTNRLYRRQVNSFAVLLELRKCTSTVYGLFVVNRRLVTSLIGNATTLLVILLQAQQQDV